MRCFFRGIKFALIAVLAGAVFGFAVMGLWNHLMPDLFGLHALTFWQALGLLVLGRLLFGRFPGRPGGHWRRRMQERWENMTPEEREKFKGGLFRCCGSPEKSEEESEEKPA